eukprot:CAMPEP_0119009746 /NCGR_PEP_ID=MMETSP1176-20130426/4579_1 /TAXON_ID=265551 /ORGANISM="Synedropsis recta cf, Strain CCMP1620" /LENGTH=443 /DNA_ID=CAMNT_0006962319 /DNA_START=46 /DNA_END=1374 /DNA_ORIENTATION=-
MTRADGRNKRWTQKSILYRGALFAVAIAMGKFLFSSSSSGVGLCTTDESLSIEPFGTVHPCDCFSETYAEARTKFREAAKERGAQLFELTIYQNYTTDIAYLPNSDSNDLLVHTSGVHGVEGYAGSAIQVALLKSDDRLAAAAAATTKSKRPSLLLIHAVNPYGMAHYRRFNENNVDLNRNGIHDFRSVLERDANLAHYADFDEQFNPTKPFRFGFFMELLPKLVQHGFGHLKQAMVTGQYHKPTGIFFGGNKGLESSNAKLHDFVKTFLDETHPPRSPGSKMTWINVHTGLGSSGIDTILFDMGCGGDGACQAKNNEQEVAKVFSESLVPGTSTGGEDVQQGYDLMQGSTEQLVRALFAAPSSPETNNENDNWLLTQEFGTIPSILVGRALILENMYHNHHRAGAKPKTAGASLLKSAFYPRTTKWRRSILVRGLRIVQQAM